MIIHQGVFGPLKGHAFIEGSSSSLEEVFRNAAWLTDLPQTAPSGVAWTPFFRLVRQGEYLLLIHTRLHTAATRAGMVLSRVAFIPVELVERIHDLRPIARILQADWAIGGAVMPIDVRLLSFTVQSSAASSLTMHIASALIQNVKRPLVVIGQDGFDEAMLDLWMRVPPEFRISLLFGLSFGEEDVRDLNIVCTPKELWARWNTKLQVDRTDETNDCSHTATLLNLPTTESSRAFANALQFSLSSLTAIRIALRAFELWTHPAGAGDDIALLRILTERAGTMPSATAIKATVIERLVSSVQEWSGKDVLSLRNIVFEAIPGADKVRESLETWSSELPTRATLSEIRDIFQAWTSAQPTSLWLSSITAGLKSAFSNDAAADLLFTEIWHSMVTLPENSSRPLTLFAGAVNPPKRFIDLAPKMIDEHLANDLMPELIARRWWQAAGTLLARSRSATQALKDALNFAPKSNKILLLTSALSEATDQEIVAAAIVSKDVTAIEIAAQACISTPDVLKSFDWLNPDWFRLLNLVVSNSAVDVLDILPDTTAGLASTIDAQLKDEIIWRVVAGTSLANLLAVPGRARAWDIIPSPYIGDIARATSNHWLYLYEAGSVTPNQLEPYLLTWIRAQVHAEEYLLQVLQKNPAAFLLYLRDFGFASERDAKMFLASLKRSTVTLSDSAAHTLGGIFRENGWTSAALDAAHFLHARPDFRPLLNECLPILSYVERMWFGFQLGLPVNLSPDEAWAAFESEAISLYPRGPSDRELWSRSGGRIEDLDEGGSGRAIWHRATLELRSGRAPGVHALLDVMIEDFQFNDTLKQLTLQNFRR